MNYGVIKMLKRVILPLLIGITVTFLLFRDDFNTTTFSEIDWNWRIVVGLGAAVVFLFGRDFGLAWRFHTIASPTLSWWQAVRVDLMCAFTSAVTPSAMGGSAFAIFYLNREGVSLGKATTMTLTTLFLDELFFVVFCPIIVFLTPLDQLFGTFGQNTFLGSVEVLFWLVYAGIVIWTAILFWGILIKPHYVATLIDRLFSTKLLRRWYKGAHEMGINMIEASGYVRSVGFRWWLNVFGATVLSWMSRYLIVNALFWGFVPESSPFLIFSRQFVVWVVLMISPTPGGSGISEWLFTEYYGDLMGATGLALILALSWRILSYYVYLIIGSILVPSYFSSKKKLKTDNIQHDSQTDEE